MHMNLKIKTLTSCFETTHFSDVAIDRNNCSIPEVHVVNNLNQIKIVDMI